jgi:hypothetical protein
MLIFVVRDVLSLRLIEVKNAFFMMFEFINAHLLEVAGDSSFHG